MTVLVAGSAHAATFLRSLGHAEMLPPPLSSPTKPPMWDHAVRDAPTMVPIDLLVERFLHRPVVG